MWIDKYVKIKNFIHKLDTSIYVGCQILVSVTDDIYTFHQQSYTIHVCSVNKKKNNAKNKISGSKTNNLNGEVWR